MSENVFTRLLHKTGASSELTEEYQNHLSHLSKIYELYKAGESWKAGQHALAGVKSKELNNCEPLFLILEILYSHDVIDRKLSIHPLQLEFCESTVRTNAATLATVVYVIETALVDKHGAKDKEEVKEVLLQLNYLLQFALFLGFSYRRPQDEDWEWLEEIWVEHRFDEIWDFSGVEPFLIDLCPPHWMLKRHFRNGIVYEVQDDGRVKEIPAANYDFKANAMGGLRKPRFGTRKGA